LARWISINAAYLIKRTSTVNINTEYNSFTKKGKAPEWVSCINLAKVLAYKLYSMKYLSDIYRFEGDVELLDINRALRLAGHGGTCIDRVIKNIHKTLNPSLIITDGIDTITEYSDLAYIINIDPDSFEKMITKSTPAVQKMIEQNQILAFIDNRFLTPKQYKLYKR
jgi:hypothetical protein